jgi:hypothetical protein
VPCSRSPSIGPSGWAGPITCREALTNASFTHAPSGAGFDWHLLQLAGAHTTFGSGELRLTFSGTQPEHCTIAWQFVATAPGEHYVVKCRGAADGLAWRADPIGESG